MEIPSKYDPKLVEDKWYSYWMAREFFKSVPDGRKPYTIVIPPPNVTGVLHMGHMLNNTIQDIMVRRARMQGKNACWVPGTDHASIATEARVVAKLKSEGIDKNTLTREQFLDYAWEWKQKHGGIILEQLKKLGASCDWERTKFTMDEEMSESVIRVFLDLFNKGLIYRGIRMVNWDPQARTAVSDEEVIYREVKSRLYYVKYRLEGSDEFITIATTRPETILGDTAVCVNPADERYQHLEGKKVIVPMVNRVVPIIRDSYVEMEFGTGCLKITPAHDINDYEIGIKYNLPSIDIFNLDGTLSEKALLFVGTDRFKARDLVVDRLNEDGLLVKVEDYINKVGFSERTDSVIEPRLSIQWFVKMKQMAGPLEEVEAAARLANAHTFIMRLPSGYQTEVWEGGVNLSAGERQLISIARAGLAQPRILVLDEATSSVDTVTELLIQDALERLLAGRTAIVIAHRLSTIRKADLICVISEGRIVEQGTHATLLAQGGLYRQLYERQFVSTTAPTELNEQP